MTVVTQAPETNRPDNSPNAHKTGDWSHSHHPGCEDIIIRAHGRAFRKGLKFVRHDPFSCLEPEGAINMQTQSRLWLFLENGRLSAWMEPAQVIVAPAVLPSVVSSLLFLLDGLLAVPSADPRPLRLRHSIL